MSPSGGAMTLVDQPITWSPENSVCSSGSAKHRWFEVWPGVCTAARRQPGPSTASPSRMTMSGVKAWSPPSSVTPPTPLLSSARPEAVGLGTGRLLDRGRRRRMVEMRVGDEDVRHRLGAERGEQRVDMRGDVGPGIDDGDPALPDDISAGALEGERARIARDDAADERRQRRDCAIIDVDVAAERDLGGHFANLPMPAPLRQSL